MHKNSQIYYLFFNHEISQKTKDYIIHFIQRKEQAEFKDLDINLAKKLFKTKKVQLTKRTTGHNSYSLIIDNKNIQLTHKEILQIQEWLYETTFIQRPSDIEIGFIKNENNYKLFYE